MSYNANASREQIIRGYLLDFFVSATKIREALQVERKNSCPLVLGHATRIASG